MRWAVRIRASAISPRLAIEQASDHAKPHQRRVFVAVIFPFSASILAIVPLARVGTGFISFIVSIDATNVSASNNAAKFSTNRGRARVIGAAVKCAGRAREWRRIPLPAGYRQRPTLDWQAACVKNIPFLRPDSAITRRTRRPKKRGVFTIQRSIGTAAQNLDNLCNVFRCQGKILVSFLLLQQCACVGDNAIGERPHR